MEPEYLKEKDAAVYLGLAVQSLRNRRTKGQPPKYYRLGKSVRYRIEDLQAFARPIEPAASVRGSIGTAKASKSAFRYRTHFPTLKYFGARPRQRLLRKD